jgi:ubiquinone biosynthesis protein COQ4
MMVEAMDTALPRLDDDAGWLERIRLTIRALRVLKDDPGHTHYGPLVNTCMDRETYARMACAWRRSDAGRALLDERPSLQGAELDLVALAGLPHDTLGHALYRYFEEHGIAPFVSDFPVETDVDYLSKRYRETHDIVHVLTGYETDDYSEMELQAFVYGALGLKQNVFIVLTGVFVVLPKVGLWAMRHYPADLLRAYRRGRASSEGLLQVRFEDLFDHPLDDVRQQLIAPGDDRRGSPLQR